MRKYLLAAILGASFLATAAHADHSDLKKTNNKLNIAVFGDSPYGTSPTDTAEFEATPAFIAAINADPDVSLVLNVGDIHSGKQYCTADYNFSIYDLWTTFNHPVVYTPGDNEWTDCHKSKEGGGAYNAATDTIDYKLDSNGDPIDYAFGNPVENLDLVRSIFFAKPGHTIAKDMRVLSQAESFHHADQHQHPASSDAKFVENVIWKQADVLFVAVNIPGGSNNGADVWYGAPTMSLEQSKEIVARTGAALRWIDEAFKQAEKSHAKAVLIQIQADMWDLDGSPASHIANYKSYIDSIAVHTKAFGKPVLLLNGDSHGYRSDNPLVANAPCENETGTCTDDAYQSHPYNYNVPNFHRVIVHGSIFPLEWLKLSVDSSLNAPTSTNTFGPYSWKRMTQE
jgi:hypothetical protein